MDPNRAASALLERLKIADRLGHFQLAESVSAGGNRNIRSGLHRKDEEYAAVVSAFMKLPRGMKITRPVTEQRCRFKAIAQTQPEFFQGLIQSRIKWKISQDPKIIFLFNRL